MTKIRYSRVIPSSLAVAAILLSLRKYRLWALNWGATEEEAKRSMPGDDVVNSPTFNATRAVSINAPIEGIWPWIIQIGYRRAGFYSYDWLDNDGIPSSDRIIPEYQDLKAGDLIPMSKDTNAVVAELESNRSMLLIFPESSQADDTWTWLWNLDRVDERQTRLVTRLRVRPERLLTRTLLDFCEIIMMRKCLLGIKSRAEFAN
jgi:hypothetical protein